MRNLKAPELNSVVIAGNLIAEPSYRYTSKGIAVSNFSIAVKRTFKDKSGNSKESICLVGVVAWHKLADICAKNLNKGSTVLIEGELQSRNMLTDNKKLRIVEVKARQVQFLDDNNKQQDRNSDDSEYDSSDKEYESEVSEEKEEDKIEKKVNKSSDINTLNNKDDNPMKGEFDFGFQDIQI